MIGQHIYTRTFMDHFRGQKPGGGFCTAAFSDGIFETKNEEQEAALLESRSKLEDSLSQLLKLTGSGHGILRFYHPKPGMTVIGRSYSEKDQVSNGRDIVYTHNYIFTHGENEAVLSKPGGIFTDSSFEPYSVVASRINQNINEKLRLNAELTSRLLSGSSPTSPDMVIFEYCGLGGNLFNPFYSSLVDQIQKNGKVAVILSERLQTEWQLGKSDPAEMLIFALMKILPRYLLNSFGAVSHWDASLASQSVEGIQLVFTTEMNAGELAKTGFPVIDASRGQYYNTEGPTQYADFVRGALNDRAALDAFDAYIAGIFGDKLEANIAKLSLKRIETGFQMWQAGMARFPVDPEHIGRTEEVFVKAVSDYRGAVKGFAAVQAFFLDIISALKKAERLQKSTEEALCTLLNGVKEDYAFLFVALDILLELVLRGDASEQSVIAIAAVEANTYGNHKPSDLLLKILGICEVRDVFELNKSVVTLVEELNRYGDDNAESVPVTKAKALHKLWVSPILQQKRVDYLEPFLPSCKRVLLRKGAAIEDVGESYRILLLCLLYPAMDNARLEWSYISSAAEAVLKTDEPVLFGREALKTERLDRFLTIFMSMLGYANLKKYSFFIGTLCKISAAFSDGAKQKAIGKYEEILLKQPGRAERSALSDAILPIFSELVQNKAVYDRNRCLLAFSEIEILHTKHIQDFLPEPVRLETVFSWLGGASYTSGCRITAAYMNCFMATEVDLKGYTILLNKYQMLYPLFAYLLLTCDMPRVKALEPLLPHDREARKKLLTSASSIIKEEAPAELLEFNTLYLRWVIYDPAAQSDNADVSGSLADTLSYLNGELDLMEAFLPFTSSLETLLAAKALKTAESQSPALLQMSIHDVDKYQRLVSAAKKEDETAVLLRVVNDVLFEKQGADTIIRYYRENQTKLDVLLRRIEFCLSQKTSFLLAFSYAALSKAQRYDLNAYIRLVRPGNSEQELRACVESFKMVYSIYPDNTEKANALIKHKDYFASKVALDPKLFCSDRIASLFVNMQGVPPAGWQRITDEIRKGLEAGKVPKKFIELYPARSTYKESDVNLYTFFGISAAFFAATSALVLIISWIISHIGNTVIGVIIAAVVIIATWLVIYMLSMREDVNTKPKLQ